MDVFGTGVDHIWNGDVAASAPFTLDSTFLTSRNTFTSRTLLLLKIFLNWNYDPGWGIQLMVLMSRYLADSRRLHVTLLWHIFTTCKLVIDIE